MEQTEQQHDDAAPENGPGNGAKGTDSSAAAAQDCSDSDQSLAEALARAEAEAARHREELLRTRAEMDNLQKRQARELDKSRRFALERVMGDLLPILDSLEAALGSEQATQEQLREGADLILKMIHKLIADHGLKEIDPLHQPFDPELHQAMSTQPTTEHDPDTVVQVFQKGYQLHDRLLRPAMVVVAKVPD